MTVSAAIVLPFARTETIFPLRPHSTRETRLARHETLFFAGDEAGQIFEIVTGAVMLTMLLEDGRRQIVDLVFVGGLVGLSDGGVHRVTCETLVPTTVRARAKLDLVRDGSLQASAFRQLERQICGLHDQSLALGRMTAQERVASLINRFLTLQQNTVKQARRLELPMTRGEMGDYLGLSLETVCRTLSELQAQKIIEIGRQHGVVTVLNANRLRCLAQMHEAA